MSAFVAEVLRAARVKLKQERAAWRYGSVAVGSTLEERTKALAEIALVDRRIGEVNDAIELITTMRPRTHTEAASALGRKGGVAGGQARAEALSPERRSEIAKQAAEKRWRR